VSGAISRIDCPKCRMKLNQYERRPRSLWQWALFRNSRKYQCENCGKKTFIADFNTYLSKANLTSSKPAEDQQIACETNSEQLTETKSHSFQTKPRIRPTLNRGAPNITDTRLEQSLITHINNYLDFSPSSNTTTAGSIQIESIITPEDQLEAINPVQTESTSHCHKVHSLLNLPNRFVIYQKTTTVEDEIGEANKVHLELQESIDWSMDNFRNSGNFKLGLIKESTRKLVESMLRNPDAVLLLSKIKDTAVVAYTHCIDASILAVLFGRHLGLTKQELNTFALGVLLLDIGKSQIPEAVLEKQKKLAPAEVMQIQKHVSYSLDILNTTHVDEEVLSIVENHHERFDGQGYPHRKLETNISVFAKMASIVDAYDAMTHNRPYRKALTARKAINTLLQQRDQQFQAELVDEFAHCLGAYPTGSSVMLNTGQAGIVVSQNEVSRLQPKVLIFRDSAKDKAITPFMQDLQRNSLRNNGKPIYIKAAA